MDRVVSVILTVAAVFLAVAVIRREFFPSDAAASGGNAARPAASLEYHEEWGSMVQYGIRQGDSAAPIQLIEFGDLECPACRAFKLRTLSEVTQRYGDQLSLTFMHFPLSRHRFARIAAQAAECADRQGRFSQLVLAVYEKQDSLGLKQWGSYGADAGIPDTARFTACVRSTEQFARIDSGLALAQRLQFYGTPTIIVNGWRFHRTPSAQQLMRVVDDLLAGREPLEQVAIQP